MLSIKLAVVAIKAFWGVAGCETGSPRKGRLLMGVGRCVAKEVYRVSLAPLPPSESFVGSQSTNREISL